MGFLMVAYPRAYILSTPLSFNLESTLSPLLLFWLLSFDFNVSIIGIVVNPVLQTHNPVCNVESSFVFLSNMTTSPLFTAFTLNCCYYLTVNIVILYFVPEKVVTKLQALHFTKSRKFWNRRYTTVLKHS